MKPIVAPFSHGKVRLRLMQAADLPLTLAWRNRDDARFWFKTTDLLSWESHRAWFARYQDKGDDFLFMVEADGVPVGQVSVYDIDRDTAQAEVGRYLVAPEAQGHGYIKDACEALIQFCTDTLQLRLLFLDVREDNTRSIRVLVACGFQEDSRSNGLMRMTLGLPTHRNGTA